LTFPSRNSARRRARILTTRASKSDAAAPPAGPSRSRPALAAGTSNPRSARQATPTYSTRRRAFRSSRYAGQPLEEGEPMIEAGKTVAFEYTLRLDDGSVVQSNKDAEPLTYVHGENQLLPALEQALEGLEVNDRKEVKLAAEDAYGKVRDEAFRE